MAHVSFSQSTPDTLNVKIAADTMTLGSDSIVTDTLNAGLSDEMKSKVHYLAEDSIIFDVADEKVYLYGKAKVEYEDLVLEANYIEVNWETKIVYASGMPDSAGVMAGRPVFKQGSDEFRAESMKYNMDTKKGIVTNIKTQQGDGYIHGEVVKKLEESSYIKYGLYTTCDLDTPHYCIAANKLKVIPNNKIITGPAYLVIEEVPTPLAIPFGLFPNKKGRSSGIVFPAYGESANLGFFLKNGGYYFGLKNKFDTELTGDIYSLGSWAVHLTSRYSNRYRFSGAFQVNYSIIKQSEKELPDYSRSRDLFFRWNHSQDPKARPNSIFSANVNAGSSSYYRNNLSSASNYLNNNFNSSISYSKTFPGKPYNLAASLTHSQNVSTRLIDVTAPAVSFGISTIRPFAKKEMEGTPKWYEKIGFSVSSQLQNSVSAIDTMFFKRQTLERMRNGAIHSIPISTSLNVAKFFTVSPSVNYTQRWYLQTVNKALNTETNQLETDTVQGFKTSHDFGASVAISTRIYGMSQFKKGKIEAFRHVITPSVSYNWRPDFGTDAFGYYKSVFDSNNVEQRYSIFEQGLFGGPSQGKYSFVSMNLDNNFEMKVRQTTDTAVVSKKVKLLESLAINTGYNLAADSLNWNPINVAARTILFDKINLQGNATFDPYIVNENNIRVNTTELSTNKRLARFTGTNLGVSFSLNKKAKKKESTKGTADELAEVNKNQDDYVDFNIPFNLSVTYNFGYSKPTKLEASVNQIAGFYGDISLTEKWKITFNSGYDFKQKDFSYTSLGFYRDLHCWEMRLNWVPFGGQANYFFQINVKSSVLQDLKMIKKNDQFDR